MSIKQMLAVWEHEFPHPEQAIMLALADHADDEGRRIFPSIEYVAWKTGYRRRNVQLIMRRLEKSGVLEKVREARQHCPTEYKFNWGKAKPKRPFDHTPQGCNFCTPEPEAIHSTPLRGDPQYTPGKPGAIHSTSLEHDSGVQSHDSGVQSHDSGVQSHDSGAITRSPDPSYEPFKPSFKPSHDRACECDSQPELSQLQNLGSDPPTEKSAPLSTKSEHAGHFTTLGSRSESSAPRQVDPTHPVATAEAYYRGGWREEFPWVESRRGFNYAYKPAMVAAVIAHLKAVPSYDGNAEELAARAVRWLNRANQDGLRASDAWAIWERVQQAIEVNLPASQSPIAEINRLAGKLQRHESWFDFLESWSAQAVGRIVSLPSQLTGDERARLLEALQRRVEEVAA